MSEGGHQPNNKDKLTALALGAPSISLDYFILCENTTIVGKVASVECNE